MLTGWRSVLQAGRRRRTHVPIARRSTRAHRSQVGPTPRAPPGRRSAIVEIGAGTARRDPACRRQVTHPEGDGSLHDRILGMLLGLACAEAVGAPFSGEERVDRREIGRWASDTRPLNWSSMTMMLHTVLARLSVEPPVGGVDGPRTALPVEFSAKEIRGLREHDTWRPRAAASRTTSEAAPVTGLPCGAWRLRPRSTTSIDSQPSRVRPPG